jgi:hypothetical protein
MAVLRQWRDIRSAMCTVNRTFRSTLIRYASTPLLLVLAAALAVACGEAGGGPSAPSGASPGTPSSGGVPASSGVMVVPVTTYEGSGQAVHPDAANTPFGWSAATTHVVATPYPNGQPRVENPSFYDVLAPYSWVPPTGATNPIAAPSSLSAHLSDPDMVYDPDSRELRVYYREVTDSNLIHLIRTTDGARWSDPVTVLAVPRHFAVSPSVVRRASGEWLMWVVNSGSDGCNAVATTVELRRSTDGVTWSAPETARIGRNAESPWHIDVEWIPSRHEYWAVYNAKRSGSCMTDVIRFATSADGLAWTEYPSPLLRAGAIAEFAHVVYRSSIAYDSVTNLVTVLYSGARASDGKYVWQVATEQMDLRTLMARVTAPAAPGSTSHALVAGARVVPELTNETAP